MSFYGSVYYQLIDTFYKVVLRNKGIENTKFLDSEKVPAEWLESQAVGRKGVFGFDTGNRWINLNTYSETDDNNNEQRSIFEIYHGAPDPEADNIFNGFQTHLSKEELQKRTIDGIIHLDYGDEFETYETKYDDAGHISEAVKKTYKLPKNKEDERLDTLEKLVGTDDKRNLPEVESDADKNLHGYVEKNTNDINTLLKYVGPWTNVAEPDNFSIAKVIGNLNNLFGTTYLGDSSFKSLSEIIGKMPDLWNGYDANLANAKYSLIQTILDLKKRYDNYTTLNDVSVGGNSNDIKIIQDSLSLDKRGELGTVYTEIINLYKALENLDIAYKQADTSLDGRLTGTENAINTINNTTFPLVDGRINTLNERVTAHEKAWAGSEAILTKDIKDLNDNFNNLTKTVTDNYNNLDKSIDDLETTLSSNASNDKQELQELINGLRADLGTKFNESNAFSAIEANAASILTINNKIGTVSEERPISVQVNDNLNSINNLNATSLTKEEATNTYVSKTALTEANYAKVSDLDNYAKVSDLDNYAKVSDLDNYVTEEEATNTYVSKTALTEANYAKVSDLDNYVTEEELIDKGYALDSVVSEISNRVQTVEDTFITLGTSEDFTEMEVPADTTILRAIFNQLAELNTKLTTVQDDIIILKSKMNELHSDNPPFSTDEEEIPPEEEEIPI